MKENWIVPCNIKHFNVIEHFKNNSNVVWKNSFTIHVGDIVYLYIGAPHGEIKYKCEVICDEISDEVLSQNKYAIVEKPSNNYFSKKIKYIQMKLLKEFPDGTFKLKELKEHGLGQVQIQARTDRRLIRYLVEMEESMDLTKKE